MSLPMMSSIILAISLPVTFVAIQLVGPMPGSASSGVYNIVVAGLVMAFSAMAGKVICGPKGDKS